MQAGISPGLLFLGYHCQRRIVPPSPVAQPDRGVANATERSMEMMGCLFQLLPPSSVCRMTPRPTAHPAWRETKATLVSLASVVLVCCLHVSPASSVWRTIPSCPTAHPSSGEGQATELSHAPVWLVCFLQTLPPSLVCKTTPSSPTAHPVSEVANFTEYNHVLIPLICRPHVSPPSFVFRMTPFSPTIQPVFCVAKVTE